MKTRSLSLLVSASLLTLLGAASLPRPVAAAASPLPRERSIEERAPRPAAWLIIDGEATLSEVEVVVDCGEVDLGLILRVATCRLTATFVVGARSALTLRTVTEAQGYEGIPDRIDVEGEALLETPRRVAAGASVRVRIEDQHTLATGYSLENEPYIMRPNAARHLALGESADIDRESESFNAPIVAGAGSRIEGEVAFDDRVPGHMSASLSQGTEDSPHLVASVSLEAMDDAGEVFQNGGPVVSLGVRVRDLAVEDGPSDFLLGLGYEVALYENFFLRAAFETDFSSMYQSLVFEAASPHVLFILPSLVVGLGGVVAERPDGRVEGALRLRVGSQLPLLVAGVGFDFDYWPEKGTWSGSITARLSF